MWPAPPRTSCCSACGVWSPFKTSDPFVQIFSFALTLAYMIGISGRNFASNLLVLAQIVCAGVPMRRCCSSAAGTTPFSPLFSFPSSPR
jgi:hypothetical protein